MEIINPQLKELERKQEELQTTVAYMRGEIDQIRHVARDTTRQTIWQFIIFTVTISAVMFGGMKYQADLLRREMDIRFQSMEQRMNDMEKNLLIRFEDLKQEVRQSRK
ncbi:MAG: hypothetical protein IPG76_00545 [Acidobacteria bacterium]|jgi:hypothetical protein|nr:hypothetical protein [Acidobacteriota bacterium]